MLKLYVTVNSKTSAKPIRFAILYSYRRGESNPKGPERKAKQSGGLFRSDGVKRAAKGSRRPADLPQARL